MNFYTSLFILSDTNEAIEANLDYVIHIIIQNTCVHVLVEEKTVHYYDIQ